MSDTPRRRPGRPSDRELDERIRDAARTLMEEEGYAAVTVSAVAKRAGLPRSTVYRRHPSQYELRYANLVLPAGGADDVVDTGDVRADVRTHVARNAGMFADEAGRRLLRALVADVMADADARRTINESFVLPRLDEVEAVLARARSEGALPPRCDPRLAAEAVTGTLIYHALVLDQPVDDDLLDRLSHLLFDV